MKKNLWFVIILGLISLIIFLRENSLQQGTNGIPVLMYHHLLENSENKNFRNPEVITPELFARQMKLLHDHGYVTVTLDELNNYVDGKEKLPQKSVAITFDDGYLSNYKYAYPILKSYHYKATIFAITGNMKQKPEKFNSDKLNYISWAEVATHSDVFRLEGHTKALHRQKGGVGFLLREPTSVVKADLTSSKSALNADYFAYPYGQYNKRAIRLLEKTGYRMAFTIRSGRVYPGDSKFQLHRIGVYPYQSMNQFKRMVGILD
jgi:peptidoglycan/xylan/chitin deacetylase (PgdA/CDA1 family)